MQANSPPAFAFTRGVSSEEDILKPLRTRRGRENRENRAVESALSCTNAEALADPNKRAQEVRGNAVLACAKAKQPPTDLNIEAKEAMVKEVRGR